MAQTGHIFSKDCSVKLVCGGGSMLLTAHGNSVDIDVNADDLEATAFGDQAHTFLQGLTNFTINYSGWWAGCDVSGCSDTTQSIASCALTLVSQSSACTPVVWVAPAGSAAGSLTYVACVNVQSAPVSFTSDSIATMNISFTARAGSLTSGSSYT